MKAEVCFRTAFQALAEAKLDLRPCEGGDKTPAVASFS